MLNASMSCQLRPSVGYNDVHISTSMKSLSDDELFFVEIKWSSTGNVGDSADEDVYSAVFEWLWGWWRRPPSIQIWQVLELWTSSVLSAGLCMLELASRFDWLARVANSSLVPTSAEETDWTWIHALSFYYLHMHIRTRLV